MHSRVEQTGLTGGNSCSFTNAKKHDYMIQNEGQDKLKQTLEICVIQIQTIISSRKSKEL